MNILKIFNQKHYFRQTPCRLYVMRQLSVLVTGQSPHWSKFSCVFVADFLFLLDLQQPWSCDWLGSIRFVLVSDIQNFPLCSLFFMTGWLRMERIFIIILLLSEQDSDCANQWLSAEKLFFFYCRCLVLEKQARK